MPRTRRPVFACVAASCATALATTAPAQLTTRESVASNGTLANKESTTGAISDDGRFVTFATLASNLVSGDTNAKSDVFLRDRWTETTTRISVSSTGVQANDVSYGGAISADGRFIAFESKATNLVSPPTSGVSHVFVHDRVTGATELISLSSTGIAGDDNSQYGALSGDGRFVVFESSARNFVTGSMPSSWNVYVHDRQTGATECVSLDANGLPDPGQSHYGAISRDGRFVAFASWSALVAGDTNARRDVFVRDRLNGVTELVSLAANGAQATEQSDRSSISADGRYIAFQSIANGLVAGDTDGNYDIFVRDRLLGTTELADVNSSGVKADNAGHFTVAPSISADGRYVSFYSFATNLAPGDTNDVQDVFVRDRIAGTTERVSRGSDGQQGNNDSFYDLFAGLSGDARYVLFGSAASNFAGPTNTFGDVFVRDRLAPVTYFCFGDSAFADHTTACPCGNAGETGKGCGHGFDPNGASLGVTGLPALDTVVLRSRFEPANSFTLFLQHDASGDSVFHDGVSCASGNLVRLRGRAATAGAALFPDVTQAQDATLTLSQRGGVAPGQGVRRYYSALYRNAAASFCPPATANVTNGVRIDW